MIKVFVVDDEYPIRAWISRLIRGLPELYTLSGTFANGEDAWAAIQADCPQLILLDIRMPGCDGLELLKRIRASALPIDVVILSNHDDFHYAHTAFTEGAYDYILKTDISPEILIELHQKLTQLHLGHTHIRMQAVLQNDFITAFLEDPPVIEAEIVALLQKYDLKLQPTAIGCAVLLPFGNTDAFDRCFRDPSQYQYNGIVNIYPFLLSNPRRVVLLFNIDSPSYLYQYQLYLHYAQHLVQDLGACVGISLPAQTLHTLAGVIRQSDDAVCRPHRSLTQPGVYHYSFTSEQTIQAQRELLAALTLQFVEKLQHDGTANLQDRLNVLLETAAELWQHDQTAARTTLCELLFSIILIPSAVFDRAAARKIAMDIQDICLSHDFEEISARIRNAFHFDSSAQTQLSSSISIAIQYVEKNYANIRSMQEIAEYCGYNTDYLYHLFKKETGVAFVDYLTRVRLFKASQLLLSSQESVDAIALQVGYNNPSYFSKKFKTHYGCSPNYYRKLNGI